MRGDQVGAACLQNNGNFCSVSEPALELTASKYPINFYERHSNTVSHIHRGGMWMHADKCALCMCVHTNIHGHTQANNNNNNKNLKTL